eukprot:gene15318-18721_t
MSSPSQYRPLKVPDSAASNMFGMRKQPPIRTLVGEGTVIEGEIRFSEGLRIDGRVLGNVLALGDERNLLVIGEKASIAGRVKAGHVI